MECSGMEECWKSPRRVSAGVSSWTSPHPQIGGTITAGGYTGEMSGDASNPLSGRMAWSANSNGYIDTVINLGPNLNGQTITLRFRFGTDEAIAAPGWNVDTISITGATCQ